MKILDKILSFLKYPVNQKYSEQVTVPHAETVYLPIEETPKEVIPPAEDPLQKRFLVNEPGRKILKNIWNSQRDNKFCPSAACNVTAVQTILSLDYPNVKDDDLFLLSNSEQVKQIIMKKYPVDYRTWIAPYFKAGNANEVYVCLIEAVYIAMGSDRYCRMECRLTADKVRKEIENGYAVFIAASFGFRGHCTAVVGYDDQKKVWVLNDSWGNWLTGYKNQNGDHVEYPMSKLTIPGYVNPTGIIIHADKRIPV